jgi:chaperonin GroES
MQTLHDKILIKLIPGDEKTPGGILIPAEARKNSGKAIVVSVGPGVARQEKQIEYLERILAYLEEREPVLIESNSVKEKDEIVFNKHAGTEVEYNGEKYLIIKDTDILMIV